MADEQEVQTVEETETVEQEEAHEEQSTETQEEVSEEPEEETLIGFADEESDDELSEKEGESSIIKRFRERDREHVKQLREREKRIAELEKTSAPPKIEVGPKPTLESCEWDEGKFEAALDKWKEDTAKAAEQESKAQEATKRVMDSYNRDLENYYTRRSNLGIADYAEREARVLAKLSQEQQAVAIQAASDPAALMAALGGENSAKLDELAKIDNPWKLAAAIAKLEGSVKVTKTKRVAPPDKASRGSASMAAVSSDKELEKLEKEAEASGDRTKVIQYRRQLKAQGK